ncbi:MAG: HAD-IA family hydrolase [Planctomycetes bacterium]|nr:HAD-IA family hydrolase [Planctomycetota bacterium]
MPDLRQGCAIRAVSFDAAGTLFVPHPGVGAVYAEVAARHGIVRDACELESRFRPAFAAAQRRWRVPYGADDSDALTFWAEVISGTFGEPLPYETVCDLYDAFASATRWRLVPGAHAAVDLARAHGLPTAVVSNFDCRLEPLLAGIGLGPFDAVVASTAVGRAKPDPAVLIEACRRLGVVPADVLHLGDSEREDGVMCVAAGARWLRVDPLVGIPLEELSAILAVA